MVLFMPDETLDALRGIAHYRKSVQMKARLRFIATWDAFVGTAIEILEQAMAKVIVRLGGRAPIIQAPAAAAVESTGGLGAGGGAAASPGLGYSLFYAFEGGGMDWGEM